jgi:hypothetical protein
VGKIADWQADRGVGAYLEVVKKEGAHMQGAALVCSPPCQTVRFTF